jgi:hypothetical protein
VFATCDNVVAGETHQQEPDGNIEDFLRLGNYNLFFFCKVSTISSRDRLKRYWYNGSKLFSFSFPFAMSSVIKSYFVRYIM